MRRECRRPMTNIPAAARRAGQTEQQDRKDKNSAHVPVPSRKAGQQRRLDAAQGDDERFPLDDYDRSGISSGQAARSKRKFRSNNHTHPSELWRDSIAISARRMLPRLHEIRLRLMPSQGGRFLDALCGHTRRVAAFGKQPELERARQSHSLAWPRRLVTIATNARRRNPPIWKFSPGRLTGNGI